MLSGREFSLRHLGTNTVMSLWPRARNQSTHNLIPRHEYTSLLPWLIAKLLPSMTIGRSPLPPSSQRGISGSTSPGPSSPRHLRSTSSGWLDVGCWTQSIVSLGASVGVAFGNVSSLLAGWEPSLISSASSSFWAGLVPSRLSAA